MAYIAALDAVKKEDEVTKISMKNEDDPKKMSVKKEDELKTILGSREEDREQGTGAQKVSALTVAERRWNF